MNNCHECEYKDNCKLGLYAVPPCDCVTEHTIPSFFEPTVWKYQNPITGRMESKPIDPYFIKNPFLWDGR